jgi:DNA ligase-1
MKAYEVVAKLEKTDGKKDKEQVLIEAFMSWDHEFFIGAKYALDDQISFGVNQVALIADEDVDPKNPGTVTFADFLTLADKLRYRKLTGHAARDAINEIAANCHGPTWNYFYRRVLLKNLRCGVDTLINKVLEKLNAYPEASDLMVPVFGCQLAIDGAKPPHDKKLVGKKYIDVKLDGCRLLTILDKEEGSVKQYSRVGIQNENFGHITRSLEALLPIIKESLVFDGDVVGENFQDLMTLFGRKTKQENNACLALFDVIPLKDFKKGYCAMSQEKRHWLLSEFQTSGLFKTHCGESVYVVPKKLVDLDTEEGTLEYKKFINNAAALRVNNKNIEGVMVKAVEAPYVCKRRDHWIKIKPFVSVSLPVLAIEMGKSDGKYAEVVGAMVCEGVDDGVHIKVNVSSGISDEQRLEFLKEPPIGMIAEIEGDDFTLDRNAIAESERTGNPPVYSLRFPRYINNF